jgi:hypothetical protein
VKEELENVLKKAAVAYFKALFRRLPGGYEKNLDTIPEFTSSV